LGRSWVDLWGIDLMNKIIATINVLSE